MPEPTDNVVRPPVDMRAAARVASRVDLDEIRLIEAAANRTNGPMAGVLQPIMRQHHEPVTSPRGKIQIASTFDFDITAGDGTVARIKATYHLFYTLIDDEALDDGDLGEFAKANGAYHSWPFVRDLVFGLTAKMGFPPYTLPVLSFAPPRPARPQATSEKHTSEKHE